MVRSICRPLTQSLCMVVVCLALLGCNEEREKKVLVQTDEAVKTVKAQKISADLANTAQQLLASPGSTGLDSPEMKTVRCGTGAGSKVIAYVPRTSSLVSNNSLPGDIAARMRSDLSSRFNPESVVSANTIDAACGTLTDIAVNSPVLQLSADFASQATGATDPSLMESITMESCGNDADGNRIPGVVVIKKFKNNPTVIRDDSKCGDSAPTDLPELALTDKDLPNWKERLTGGDASANKSILCIAGTDDCGPVNPGDMGSTIICNEDEVKEELVANPTYNRTTASFDPSPLARSCGKGWTGQMIARLKTKQCKVTRNGTASLPATVIDVAYVGAKCEKNNVLLEDACPIGSTFAATGRMMANKHLVMTDPISLLPQTSGNANTSQMAYDYIDSVTNTQVTNLTGTSNPYVPFITTLLSGGDIPVRQGVSGGGVNNTTMKFFAAQDNLTGINDTYAFDGRFAQTLVKQDKVGDPTITACFAVGQTCEAGDPIRMISVVVDRSGSMGAGGRSVTPTQTSCRATMANLFTSAKRHNACVAARAWQNIANGTYDIHAQAVAAWNAQNEPVHQGSQLYDAIIADADQYIQQGLATQEAIMIDALDSAANVLRLKNGLVQNQDCYPSAVQDNTYGSCAQFPASEADLKASNFSFDPANGGQPLMSCQSTCPGVCVTDAVSRVRDLNGNGNVDGSEAAVGSYGFVNRFVPSQTRAYPTKDTADPTNNYLPITLPSAYRMKVVDLFVRNNLMTNLPLGVKLYYSEFINSTPDNPAQANIGAGPVEITLDNDNDPTNNNQNVDMTFWWNKIFERIGAKFDARGSELNGMTPLYVSTDPAIDKLISGALQADPNAPTALVILSDGADSGSSSKYFGNNFCEDPKPIPTAWQCQKCVDVGKNGRDCSNKLEINIAQVKSMYGINTPANRNKWCVSKQYDNYNEVKSTSTVRGQVDSLVGIIGANFPKTKIFYLGIDGGSLLANNCNNPNNPRLHYTDPATGIPRQVLYAFSYDDSASDQMYKAFQEATGGGLPDPEVGKRMCELKFNVGVNVSYDVPPVVPLPNISFNNQVMPPTCKVEYADVTAPPGTVVLPPNYVPDPIFPPPGNGNPYDPYNYNECIPYGPYENGYYNGYTNDGMMTPCQTQR